jgi:hypothetical protein
MSTTLLYNMFGIRGYEYCRADYHQGAVCFVIEQPREKYRCPECGSAAVNSQGNKDRFLRHSPSGESKPRPRQSRARRLLSCEICGK